MNKKLKWVLIGLAVIVAAGVVVWATLFRYRPIETEAELYGVWSLVGEYESFNFIEPLSSFKNLMRPSNESHYSDFTYLIFTNNHYYDLYGDHETVMGLADYMTYRLNGAWLNFFRSENFAEKCLVEQNSFHLKMSYGSAVYMLYRKTSKSPQQLLEQLPKE